MAASAALAAADALMSYDVAARRLRLKTARKPEETIISASGIMVEVHHDEDASIDRL